MLWCYFCLQLIGLALDSTMNVTTMYCGLKWLCWLHTTWFHIIFCYSVTSKLKMHSKILLNFFDTEDKSLTMLLLLYWPNNGSFYLFTMHFIVLQHHSAPTGVWLYNRENKWIQACLNWYCIGKNNTPMILLFFIIKVWVLLFWFLMWCFILRKIMMSSTCSQTSLSVA